MFRILWQLSAHGTMLAWGSEHVQNIMTTVCTWYKVIKSTVRTHYKLFITTVCTWYKVIKSTVRTHYKLFITTVCTWCKVINSTFGTISFTFSFQLHIATCILPPNHDPLHNNLLLPHTDPLDGFTFVIFDTFVTGSDCFWWLVTGEENTYGYNTFCYCSGIC